MHPASPAACSGPLSTGRLLGRAGWGVAVAAALLAFGAARAADPFRWNAAVPEKVPAGGGNGKVVLFDVSHGGTQGNADWVIDGGFSDFADALVEAGYTVREYRGVDKDGDGIVRFRDDRPGGPAAAENEAVITFDAIKDAAVFVMAETNRPLTKAEYAALKAYVDSGKGLFLIADHYNADRNLDSWDATEVFNGYNRSAGDEFDIGGDYGDLRNPGDAGAGWLAENFGVRFRFNAIDCKTGVSDVVDPNGVEGVTQGVGPILTAAGATLAVVDPTKAKGVVYLADDDDVRSWNNAVEGSGGGLYFGGRDEGPYVAIAKPGAGKAAFIGDSSPIEDKSPKYLREDNGRAKKLHNGWQGAGSASVLCLNLVNWLATPESYSGFSTSAHPPGQATPEAMADIEKTDPDQGRPWATPSGGYDPWDPDTFRPGSYGARNPSGRAPGGGGTSTPPAGPTIGVVEALGKPEGTAVTVEGVIEGEVNGRFGLRLADVGGAVGTLAVKLPKPLRAEFNPKENPDARGKKARVTGRLGKYVQEPGIVAVTSVVYAD